MSENPNGQIPYNPQEPSMAPGELYPLITAESMYRYFLHKISRERSTVVDPDKFRRYVNASAIEWVKSKLPMLQFNQKRIDDLQVLHVDTDGTFYSPIAAKSVGNQIKTMFPYPTPGHQVIDQLTYPPLLHGISAMFELTYKGNDCTQEEGFVVAKYLKTDASAVVLKNTYTKPKDDRLYFEIINNYIRLLTGKQGGESQTEGKRMRLQYYRYPREIVYSINPLACQDSEFSPTQNLEIVDLAVIDFLEKSQDNRLNTFIPVERNKEQFK